MADEAQRIPDLFRLMEPLAPKRGDTYYQHVGNVLRRMPCLSEAEEHLFWKECLQHPSREFVLLAAVRYNRTEQLLNVKELDLNTALPDPLFTDVLRYLVSNHRWPCVKMFIEAFSSAHTAEVLHCMSFEYLCDAGLDVFQMLLDRCSECHVPGLRWVVKQVMERGFSRSFRVLIFSHSKIIRRAVEDVCSGPENHLVQLVICYWLHRTSGSYLGKDDEDFEGCLSLACEAGLFLDFKFRWLRSRLALMSPSVFASKITYYHLPDMALFLHTAGAASTHDLFELTHELPASSPSDDPNDSFRRTRDFIAKQSSRPRSLQSLCLLKVSSHLGWGHIKEANVGQLNIPHMLKDMLKFKGIGSILVKN